jgi:hypothetical protein
MKKPKLELTPLELQIILVQQTKEINEVFTIKKIKI